MPALDFDATAVPADIVAALSLADGTRYFVQHVGTVGTLKFRETAVAPAPAARGFKIEAGGVGRVKPDGTPIWFWTDGPGVPVILGIDT